MLGQPWPEIARKLAIDDGGTIAAALATHQTFSGIVLNWPVEGSGRALPVEMSGLRSRRS